MEAIQREHNAPWPASQAPDPIRLPELVGGTGETLTIAELRARLAAREPVLTDITSAEAVRAERDAR